MAKRAKKELTWDEVKKRKEAKAAYDKEYKARKKAEKQGPANQALPTEEAILSPTEIKYRFVLSNPQQRIVTMAERQGKKIWCLLGSGPAGAYLLDCKVSPEPQIQAQNKPETTKTGPKTEIPAQDQAPAAIEPQKAQKDDGMVPFKPVEYPHVTRAELMKEAQDKGIKYFRILNRVELETVLAHPNLIEETITTAKARWKSGWGKRGQK